MQSPEKQERLMELIGLLRDAEPGGGLDESQATELESILQDDPQSLAYYVESMDVIAMLHRQQGLVVLEPTDGEIGSQSLASTTPASRRRWMMAGFCAALCASLLVGILAGRLLTRPDDDSTRDAAILAARDDASEIATLSSASGCRWDSPVDSRYEGQRLTPGSLRLVEGVAVVHFDSDVSLVLEGPAHLELANVDRAMLHRGKAVFSGANDLDQFTLETPFSRIQDEGTEYAVIVDPKSQLEEIHVFDGRVIRDPVAPEPGDAKLTDSPDRAVKLDAGQARRFDGPHSMEAIDVDSSRFIRKPAVHADSTKLASVIESFSYDRESLAGRSGGTGWETPWRQPSRYDAKQGATVRIDTSLPWSGRGADAEAGSLLIEGDVGLHRTLREPIRMDRDVAYYMSFLVRKDPNSKASGSKGWACITLRNAADKKGSITFSLRGKPRASHDGRSTEATSQLRDDVVYLFVCKILARQNKDDQVTVRIYGDHEPVDLVEPSAWSMTTRAISDDSVLSELRLYSKKSERIQLDDIRIGKTWSSVTSPF